MGHLLVSGSFCVLLKPKHVGMALYEPLYLCVCVSQLRSPSLLNSERPWGRPHPGVGRGEGGVVSVSFITSLFPPLSPSGRARPQCSRLSAGGLAVIESSPGAWQPPPSGQAGVGGGGGTCPRTPLWALRLSTGLVSESAGRRGTWECRCV